MNAWEMESVRTELQAIREATERARRAMVQTAAQLAIAVHGLVQVAASHPETAETVNALLIAIEKAGKDD